MKTRLLLIRHGNTFDKGDIILRVGAKTDLDLSSSGIEQAKNLGDFVKENFPKISKVYTSPLKRTKQTAKEILEKLESNLQTQELEMLNEIDYGDDDGKPEEEIIKKYGEDALKSWDKELIPPSKEWKVDIEKIVLNWKNFSKNLILENLSETIIVVSSNGVLRFAPHILEDVESFYENNKPKMSTGAISSFVYENKTWKLEFWNNKLR